MMKPRFLSFVVAVAFLCLPPLVGRAQNAERKVKIITKETPFGKRYDAVNDDLLFSPDGKRLAYWAWTSPAKNKMFVVVNGVPGKSYDYAEFLTTRDITPIPPGKISFSPDSQHMAYRGKRGDQWLIVRDGKEEKLYDGVKDDIVWSPNSRHLAYQVKHDSKWLVVRDSKEGKPFVWIADDDLHFSADSKRLAYLVASGTHYLVVVDDGTRAKESIYRPSAAGKRMTRVLQRGEKVVVVVDGRPGKEYDRIFKITDSYDTGLRFSPDGKHVAYAATIGKKELVVLDGKEGKFYDMVTDLSFSPDSSRFAYVATVVSAEKDYQHFLVLDGKEGAPTIDKISELTFSPDSQHLVYVLLHYTTQRGIEGATVVRDGKKEGRYEGIENLRFSPDSRHLSYTTSVTKKDLGLVNIIMRDGKQYNVLDASSILSPDGRHVASVVERGKGKIVVRDGQESKLYSEVYALGFSPDNRHLAFWGKSNGKWFIVVDGVASNSYLAGPGSKPFTQFGEAEDAEDLWQLLSNSSKSLQTIALRADEQIVRVQLQIIEE